MEKQRALRGLRAALTRRQAVALGFAVSAGGALAEKSARRTAAAPLQQATPQASPDPDAIMAVVRETMTRNDLKAAIFRVLIDGEEVITAALGESMTGVPATTDMHFRNGAVTYSYIATLLLRLVDQKKCGLDDPLATWMPEVRDADNVTLRMLVNMTSGYPDYVQNPKLDDTIYTTPFRAWTNQELIDLGLSTPQIFPPGTNWVYSHTNFVLLAEVLAMIAGKPIEQLMQEEIFTPLGMKNTTASTTAEIPQPVLHAFSSERRVILGVPAGKPFYEEATYWDPSWTLAAGTVQTTDVTDMATSLQAVGEGTLLTPESHQAQVAPVLLGFGKPVPGCVNCRTLNEDYNYGLGVVLHGDWIMQNPLYGGYAAIGGYYPGKKLTVVVANTFGEKSFDAEGNYASGWQDLFRNIATLIAPESMPPSKA